MAAQWLDFTHKVVLVTGAAQGIGRAISHSFAAQGARLVLADIQAETLAQTAHELQTQGAEVYACPVDLAHHPACLALIQQTQQHYGRLDVLIHNAGYFPLTPFTQITPARLQRTLDVNLAALFWLAQAALPAFQAQGQGRLLVTSSVTGPRVAYPGLSHYAASKAGVNGFIRAAALELAPWQITVNGVEPGMIRTPAMENLGNAEHHTSLCRRVPLGRLGEGQDIANAMLFLASDAASYITGQTIVVDGGATLPENGVMDT